MVSWSKEGSLQKKYQGNQWDLSKRPGLSERAKRAAVKLGENKNQGDLTERPGQEREQ